MQTFPLYTVIICDPNSLNQNSHLSRSEFAPLGAADATLQANASA